MRARKIVAKTRFVPLIIPMLAILFNLFLLRRPMEATAAARDGLNLWFNNALPSLLPFIAGVNILNNTGFSRLLGALLEPVTAAAFNVPGDGGYAFLTGLLSGYPVGAKTIAELRMQKRLTQTEAQRLIGFCNNAGPLFIVGVAGAGLFDSVSVGYCLWLSHIAAALTLGIFLRFYGRRAYMPRSFQTRYAASFSKRYETSCAKRLKKPHIKRSLMRDAVAAFNTYRRDNDCSPGRVLGESVKNAMETVTLIGGFIIFFSVAARAATLYIPLAGAWVAGHFDWPPNVIPAGLSNGLLVGLLEVTNGIKQLAINGGNLPIIAASAVIAFGGCSIHAQTFHFIRDTDIYPAPYLLCKCVHALLAAVFCALLLPLFTPDAAAEAFSGFTRSILFPLPVHWIPVLLTCAILLFSGALRVWYTGRKT